MSSSSLKRLLLATAVAAAAVASLPAHAAYNGIVFFGDSLSDSGNVYLAQGGVTTPNSAITSNFFIPSNAFTPSAPYPFGVFSNGPVWATHFAAALGLNATPALAGGTNFAFGGARTSGGEPPPSLSSQLGLFLGGTNGVAPSSFLYVVAGGGNNARDALQAIGGGANFAATAGAAAYQYAADVGKIVDGLQAAGAKDIVVWNTPDVGLAPAVRNQGASVAGVATTVSALMNGALAQRLEGESGVQTFDLFGFLNQVVANKAAYGLSNVTDSCYLGACVVNEQLFWDGIHPTARGHEILAQAMYAQVVPEPETYLLFAVGLAALGWRSRKRAR